MDKLIATTFKILFLSILLMFLLDTSLLIVELVSVHSKVSSITSLMQTEIARNNCMPTDMGQGFRAYLNDIADTSRIMIGKEDIVENFTGGSLTIDGKTYPSLSATDSRNIGDYGDLVTLAVEVTVHPDFAYMTKPQDRTGEDMSWLKRRGAMDYTLKYIYTVPCLRYLK